MISANGEAKDLVTLQVSKTRKASKLLKVDAGKHCGEKNRAAEKNHGHIKRFCVSHFGNARMFSKQQLS